MREFKDLKIAVAGTGYVGLSIATLLSQHHKVTAVDIIPEKVELINNKKSPIQDEYIEKYLAEKELDLTATLDAKEAYSDADFVVIAAPTNYDSKKNFFDTSAVEAVIKLVIEYNPEAIMVIKSTIPVGYTARFVQNLGNDGVAVEFEEQNRVKLLSVGRLGAQKGFDLAIKSAKILKDRGVDFIWIILGEGPDRKKLQEQIDADELNNNVKLIGIRSNPYVYIKKCDIFVQTSRFEGKSIVLDEAKIFCKPIVVTNYPTVGDSIVDGQNGLIVEMDECSIADGIQRLLENTILAESFVSELRKAEGNEKELNRYIGNMLDI